MDEIDLEYETRGEGAPLLLIKGLGAPLVVWPDALGDVLVRAGFRVVRFDHRDLGLFPRLRGQARQGFQSKRFEQSILSRSQK